MITKASVLPLKAPNFNYEVDSEYDASLGFNEMVDYSSLRTISPEVSKLLWNTLDKEMFATLKYFVHNVQRVWEVKYDVRNIMDYQEPEAALGIDVEYFGFWATADDRLRYISENISASDEPLINKVGNALASHFYGARNVHQAMTGQSDPKKALIKYDVLADEQLTFKKTGVVGEYTYFLRKFLEQQKAEGIKFWGTTELHTSLQTAGRRFVNEWYLGDRMHADKGTTANVAEWIASWRNTGRLQEIIDGKGMKDMCDALAGEWGIGDYYKFHGGSDLTLMTELTAYLDERHVIPGPGATNVLKTMWPDLTPKQVSLSDRIIWLRENQHELLELPEIHPFFHELIVDGVSVFPEPINDIKCTQAEVVFCQFGVYLDLVKDPKKIAKRTVARNCTT